MSARSYFITGTDTDVGKTFIACRLLAKAHQQGLSTAAIKPVAAGAILEAGQLRNDDATLLLAECSEAMDYSELNPVCFEPAIAPHIAAAAENYSLSADSLLELCGPAMHKHADFTLIEGAGGWLVPINETETLANLAVLLHKRYGTQVILVVRIKLGCINHALLSAQSIRAAGVPIAGWIANCMEDMNRQQENISSLQQCLNAPCLGIVPTLLHDQDIGATNIGATAESHTEIQGAYLRLPEGISDGL